MRRPHHDTVRHAGINDIVDVFAASADQPRILETRHALADGEFTHGRLNLLNASATGPVAGRECVPFSRQPALSFSATRGAKYVSTPSQPARLKAIRLSIIARSPSSQPFWEAAMIIAYSPDT